MRHAIVTGIDDQEQVAARALFGRYPWVGVEDSTRRVYHGPEDAAHDVDPLAHVLGGLGPVDVDACREDPFAADPYRRYLGNERLGRRGLERLAEGKLRGWRGRYQRNRDGVVIEDTRPRAGGDVTLTIRRDLQDRLYWMFDAALAPIEDCTGGAIVVLDVHTRECLALVSYPSYDPNTIAERYDELSLDARWQPLRFRAVANRYAPGSIVKPLVCLAGLHEGCLDANTRFDCRGALFADHPRRWRCWPNSATGARMRHGELTAREAIKNSCNIFMYQTGELLGVRRLTEYFDMAGLGRSAGTGLIEEASGTNPDARWLAKHPERRVTPGMARNLAIGQGELSVTALQTANLIAFYASGKSAPVSLVRGVRTNRVEWYLDIDKQHWGLIRKGLFDVVNDPRGTARGAKITPRPGFVLCGKTGSAQAVRRPLTYRVTYGDAEDVETTVIVPAITRRGAIAAFTRQYPDCAIDRSDVVVHRWWPEDPPEEGRSYSHAWFGAFLQPVDANGEPHWEQSARIAFTVLVEFGESGGRVSAPIGKQVAQALLEILGPQLDPDHPPAWSFGRREVAAGGRDPSRPAASGVARERQGDLPERRRMDDDEAPGA